jgi:hypothetical protein
MAAGITVSGRRSAPTAASVAVGGYPSVAPLGAAGDAGQPRLSCSRGGGAWSLVGLVPSVGPLGIAARREAGTASGGVTAGPPIGGGVVRCSEYSWPWKKHRTVKMSLLGHNGQNRSLAHAFYNPRAGLCCRAGQIQ